MKSASNCRLSCRSSQSVPEWKVTVPLSECQRTQLKERTGRFSHRRETPESDSELQEKVRDILSCMVKEPLSIGSWRKLASSIVENSSVFALDENLKEILERTLLLFQVKPKKIREQGGMKISETGEIRPSATARCSSIQKHIGNRFTTWYRDYPCIFGEMEIRF